MAAAAADEGLFWPEVAAFSLPSSQTYARWRVDEGILSFAAIPLARREGGILLALPAEFRDVAALSEAEVAGFPGLIGPCQVTSAPLLGAASRPLSTVAAILVVDIELSEAADESIGPLGEELLRDGVTFVPFSMRGGRTYWPHPASVRTMLQDWRRIHGPELADGEEPLPGAERATPYHTASEAAPDEVEEEFFEPLGGQGDRAEGILPPRPRAPPAATPRQGRPLLVAPSKYGGRAAGPPAGGAAASAAAAATRAVAPDEGSFDGAPMTRAEFQAETRRILEEQAALSAGPPLGGGAGVAPPRSAAPQLFAEEAARIGLPTHEAQTVVLDEIVGRSPVHPPRLQNAARARRLTSRVARAEGRTPGP